jgi:hypothetical protein
MLGAGHYNIKSYTKMYNIVRTCDERQKSAQRQRDGCNRDGRLHVSDRCRGDTRVLTID